MAAVPAGTSAGSSTGFGGFMSSAGGQAAAQGGFSIGGNLFSAREAKKANKRNIALQQKQNDWSEHMSNTAWQRGVADMLAAGINPMVAFNQGGASTPSNSAATVNPEPEWSGAFSAAAKAANTLAVQQQAANVDLTKATAEKTRAEAWTAGQQAAFADQNAMLDNMFKGEQWIDLKRRWELSEAQAEQIKQMLPLLKDASRAQKDLTDEQTNSARAKRRLDELSVPEAESTARWFSNMGTTDKAASFGTKSFNLFKDILNAMKRGSK